MAAIPVATFTDGSGALVAGATAEDALPVNKSRQYLLIQNLDDTDALWVNFATDAVADQPSIRIVAGASAEWGAHTGVVPTGRVSVIGATLGNKYVVKEG